jgi:hypothetical protein
LAKSVGFKARAYSSDLVKRLPMVAPQMVNIRDTGATGRRFWQRRDGESLSLPAADLPGLAGVERPWPTHDGIESGSHVVDVRRQSFDPPGICRPKIGDLPRGLGADPEKIGKSRQFC